MYHMRCPAMSTAYHAKYFAYELTKRCASDSMEQLAVRSHASVTDPSLLKKLVSHIAAGALQQCQCGCAETTIVPTSEKTTMPHFVCDGCGRFYAFNGFLILHCNRAEHILDIDADAPGVGCRSRARRTVIAAMLLENKFVRKK